LMRTNERAASTPHHLCAKHLLQHQHHTLAAPRCSRCAAPTRPVLASTLADGATACRAAAAAAGHTRTPVLDSQVCHLCACARSTFLCVSRGERLPVFFPTSCAVVCGCGGFA
jgi:hypothetical protein